MKVINIEFKRWTVVKQGSINGNYYRISKFCPDGKFQEYTAAIKCLGEYLPFKGHFATFDKHLTLESAEASAIEYIKMYCKANQNAIGMDY